ncbi:MAG: DUF4145 domain-containing protein [Thermodesulfovibrionales bacterium]|nr:DUF4145 domain-containing protein [Thermodesulfovibrionales bacterium]
MNDIIKAHCNRCQGERNQEVLHSEEFSWEEKLDDGYPISGTDIYEMLKCCGCDSIILRHTEWFSGNMDSEGKLYPVFHFYPPAISRPEPPWLHELNTILDEEKEFIYDLMKEIYSSLHNNSRRVATMGIRALLEHIMINKVGDRGSFSKNIDALGAEGLISLSQEELLKTILEAGHATIHRAYSPTTEDLHTCMDIAESIVASIYIHPDKANKLKKKIPKRQ